MAISYFKDDVPMPHLKRRATTRWIRAVAAQYGWKVGELSYMFCSDAKILEVNRTYLQHDYFTDIITFDYDEEETIHGDIYISLDTIRSNSERFDVSFEDELDRVIIHGVLHLCGQNDLTPEDEAEMHRKEEVALAMRDPEMHG